MCTYYDENETSKQCAEDDAEEVRDKQAANFCDYFKLASGTFDAAGIRAHTAAEAELADLFGDSSSDQTADPSTSKTRLTQDAEALFKK